MLLTSFPRPPNDNGLGMHLGFDLSSQALELFVPRLIELDIKWCVIPHRGEGDLERAARSLARAGIMPISRWVCTVDENLLDFVRFVRVFQALNLPTYVQIFNEPSNPHEWRDQLPKPRAFIARWCDHAARVANAGGLPGLQVLHVQELVQVLRELKTRNAQHVIERMWFCPHPYGLNHPPDYPYDELNQREHPGATLADDDATVLQFLEFAPVFSQEIGFVPPFVAGECGWQYGNAADPRYPKIDDAHHAAYHAALFDWFRTGILSNGETRPDYLFAGCPWILYGPEADAWYSSTTGVRQQTIEFLKRRLSEKSAPPTTPRRAEPPTPTTPPRPVFGHYLLMRGASGEQWFRLVLLRRYLTGFNVAFGFSLSDALRAERVTIVGETQEVSLEDEARLKAAGVRVERWLGDLNALQVILSDRLIRDTEFG